MSKTIEFVGENIKDIKISIEGYKRLKTFYLSQENYEDCVIMSLEQNIKYLENKLSVWEQIKTELEAWEVVKDKISITVYYDNEQDYEEDINSHNAICLNSNLRLQNSNNEEEWFVPLTDEESKKFKKALEEENVKNKR